MSEIDLSPLSELLNPYKSLGRSGLLPALHAAQKHYGWLPQEVAAQVAQSLTVPLADVHGVIEFYSLFYNEPVGKRMIRVCTDPACALKGADDLLDHLCVHHGIQPNQTTPDAATTVERSPCLGLCELAPAILFDNQAETNVNLKSGHYDLGLPKSIVGGSLHMLTKNCGGEHGVSLKSYGNYVAYEKALKMSPADVVAEIKSSGLVGRG